MIMLGRRKAPLILEESLVSDFVSRKARYVPRPMSVSERISIVKKAYQFIVDHLSSKSTLIDVRNRINLAWKYHSMLNMLASKVTEVANSVGWSWPELYLPLIFFTWLDVRALIEKVRKGEAVFVSRNDLRDFLRAYRERKAILMYNDPYRRAFLNVAREMTFDSGLVKPSGAFVLFTTLRLATFLYRHGALKGERVSSSARNLFSVVIDGPQGIGKTSLAFYSVYGALRLLGMPHDMALSTVRACTFTKIEDAILFVDKILASRDLWAPALILDDAGVHVTKYWIFKKGKKEESRVNVKDALIEFFSILQLIRRGTAALIATTPNIEAIAKGLREQSEYVMQGIDITSFLEGDVVQWSIFRFEPRTKKIGPRSEAYISSWRVRVKRGTELTLTPAIHAPPEYLVKFEEEKASVARTKIHEIYESLMR